MRHNLILSVLAAAAIAFGIAGYVQADDSKKTEAPVLGQSWKKVRDSLDAAYGELQDGAGVKPADICDDDTFLRRIYLDLTGAPPSPEEIVAFNPGGRDVERNRGQEKREAIVEKLLASPEFSDHMATWWRVVMTEREGNGNYHNMLDEYLRKAFAENRPWNKVVHELIAVEGDSRENPAMGYLLNFENDRVAMSGLTSKIFLGRQIQCAECHDHPYEDWKMDDFEGFTGFFRLFRTGARNMGDDRWWYTIDTPVSNQMDVAKKLRLKGKYKVPQYLGAEAYQYEQEKTLRRSLADWMTGNDNPWFREMTVNRYLDYFLGVGFINPVDDFNSFNQPPLPVVMEIMGKDFAASGFDMRYLIRAITTSKIYQREVNPNRTNREDRIYYSRQYVRSLTPELVENSIFKVFGIDRLNPHGVVRDVPDNKLTEEEKRWKMTRDRIRNYKGYVRRLIRDAWGGDPVIKDVDNHDGNILQALMFLNAELIPQGVNHSLQEILAKYEHPADRIKLIFMTVLGRKPSARDIARMNAIVAKWDGGDTVYEDLFVALMNTTEFVNRH
jgi:hypothetical protein